MGLGYCCVVLALACRSTELLSLACTDKMSRTFLLSNHAIACTQSLCIRSLPRGVTTLGILRCCGRHFLLLWMVCGVLKKKLDNQNTCEIIVHAHHMFLQVWLNYSFHFLPVMNNLFQGHSFCLCIQII